MEYQLYAPPPLPSIPGTLMSRFGLTLKGQPGGGGGEDLTKNLLFTPFTLAFEWRLYNVQVKWQLLVALFLIWREESKFVRKSCHWF